MSSGFDRPNLAFDVVRVEGKGAVGRKRAALLHALQGAEDRPAIVYCGTRKDTEEVAELIAERGIATVAYHAGLSPAQRRRAQAAFMDGGAEVVVATNAFGMGVDKADVRTVAHWAIPTSLEAYYQEAGRGGRDGKPARALLLASRMDLGRLIRFNTERQSSVEDVRAYVNRLEPQGATGGRGDRPAASWTTLSGCCCRSPSERARQSCSRARAGCCGCASPASSTAAPRTPRSRQRRIVAGSHIALSSGSSPTPRSAAASRSSSTSATPRKVRGRAAAAACATRTRSSSGRLRRAPHGRADAPPWRHAVVGAPTDP